MFYLINKGRSDNVFLPALLMFFNFYQARSARIESCLNGVSSFNLATLDKNEGHERSLDFFCFVFCVKTKNEVPSGKMTGLLLK